MNEEVEDPTALSEPTPSGAPGAPANFSRHDVDVNAADITRGGHEEASYDRHDVDADAPDAIVETEQATFDRQDIDALAPDSVDEEDEATYDRHDQPR
jgi:hypothetical protein